MWLYLLQVLPIWEGTTNVLSLDVLRAIAKSKGSILQSLQTDVNLRLEPIVQNKALRPSAEKVQHGLQKVLESAKNLPDRMEVGAREFAFSIAKLYMGTCSSELIENLCMYVDELNGIAQKWSSYNWDISSFSGLLLLEHANWNEASEEDVLTAVR